ncbi:MAG: hypothetical protein FJX77_00150 [Armatimonadetes bacterium]|nr:hypothetical protein [Armatimonadota bacterium]
MPEAGYAALVVVLDFRPYEAPRLSQTVRNRQIAQAVRQGASPPELDRLQAELAPPRVTYSDREYLQMLSLLRTFIDSIGDIKRTLLTVMTSPEYHLPHGAGFRQRSINDYDALQTRIGQEVYDTRRPNPCAALSHLG